jgi:hypothetical protein
LKKSLILDLKIKNKPRHRSGGSGCAGYTVAHPVYGRMKALKMGEIL